MATVRTVTATPDGVVSTGVADTGWSKLSDWVPGSQGEDVNSHAILDVPADEQDDPPPFATTEKLIREYTVTFPGHVVQMADMIAGFRHIKAEASDGDSTGEIVVTTDGDGHVVLYFSTEDTYRT